MELLFRRSTHDEDGNYKFAKRDRDILGSLEGQDDFGLVHHLSPDKWMRVGEIIDDLRSYEDQFRGDLDACTDMAVPQILRNLAYLVENGYAEAKETP